VVADDQVVHKGDVIYVIDPFDYQVAVETSRAEVQNRAADLKVKLAQAARRHPPSTSACKPRHVSWPSDLDTRPRTIGGGWRRVALLYLARLCHRRHRLLGGEQLHGFDQ
jgi:multidrug efflux pump subunit AcrA (membrane-fusion protein)